jgi:iron complex outermembrane receptor protein
MRSKGILIRTTALLGCLAAVSPGIAQATTADAAAEQTAAADPGQVDDIVVTARKRDESLTSVPLSISALTSAKLEMQNIKSTVDLSDFTPGFNQRQQVGGVSGLNNRLWNSLVFRGLNLANNTGLTAAGLLFLDGAPVVSGQLAGIVDVERVEVLRGPQSAYFGRSTFSGAINYITKAPGDEFKGTIAAEYSSFGSTDDSFSLEGPAIPGLLNLRVSGQHIVKGGQYTNAGNRSEKLGKQETNSLSLSAYMTPAEGLTIKGYVSYFELRDGPPAQAALKPTEANCPAGRTILPYFCGVVPRIPAANISANYRVDDWVYQQMFANVNNLPTVFDPRFLSRGGLKQNTWQGDLIVNYDIGGYTLTSVTAFHTSKTQQVSDVGYRDSRDVPNPLFGVLPNTLPYIWWLNLGQATTDDFSQELRISTPADRPLRLVAGANYITGKQVGPNSYGLSTFGTADFASPSTLKAETPSVFGGIYYDIFPSLTISGEARYQWDKVTQTPWQAAPFSKTFKSFSPRVTLDYEFMPDSTIYALWSRGYRPGGFNTDLVGQPQSVIDQVEAAAGSNVAYDQERIDNFEAGIKARFWDGRATASLSVYTGKLSDMQNQSTVNAFLPGGNIRLFTITTNLGKTNFRGIEFEGSVRPIPQLLLAGTFAFNDTNIRRFDCSECATFITGSTDVKGNRLSGVPRTTGTLTANWTDGLSGDWNWYTQGDFIYQGTIYADLVNLAETGDTRRVNLRFGVEDGQKSLEVFVTNLTQEDTYLGLVRGVDALTFTYNELRVALPEKRTWGVRGRVKF